MKEGRRGKWLTYTISIIWLFSMALAGFFIPYFTDNIPFFKVKALHIEGLETIPPDVIAEEVGKLKNNWLFINEGILLKNINKVTGNSIHSVEVKRSFGSKGVELRIRIKERKPIFTVLHENNLIFFDEDGNRFLSDYRQITNPIVYTHQIELITNDFENMKNIIDTLGKDLREAYITNLNTIIYTKEGVKITLPPLFLLNRELIQNVARIHMYYNIGLDVKEMEISMEGLVIIRGGKEK
ncbi:MAG: hypothetical protein NZ851_01760 [Aquificaceae bacterium]|nr:hypothetical protein [Aquificaceae bacterium]